MQTASTESESSGISRQRLEILIKSLNNRFARRRLTNVEITVG